MPVHRTLILTVSATARLRPNYWGYDSWRFFSPHRGYAGEQRAVTPEDREFKEMVRRFRRRVDIEVIACVALQPHGRRQRRRAPTLSFAGLRVTRGVYYIAGERRAILSQLHGLRKHSQRQPPHRPRDDLRLSAALGTHLPRRRLPLRSGLDPQPRPRRQSDTQSAGGRVYQRGSAACRHENHCGGVGRRGSVPGGPLRRVALGRVERTLSRRRSPLLAGRSGHDRTAGHAAGRFQRSLPGQRAKAVPQHQLHSRRTMASR